MVNKTKKEEPTSKGENKKSMGFLTVTRGLFKLLQVPKMRYIIPFSISFFRNIIVLLTPFYMKLMIDIIETNTQSERFLPILIILLILNTLSFISNIFTQRYLQKLGIYTIYDLRKALFGHLQHLSMSYYHKNKTGKVMSFLTNDADAVNNLISTTLINLILQILQMFGSLFFMIYISWRMCLILVIMMPILFVSTKILMKKANERVKMVRENVSEVTGDIQETMDGLRTIKSMRTESYIQDKVGASFEKEKKSRDFANKLWSKIYPFNESFSYISVGLTIVYGGYLYFAGYVTSGTIFAFILYYQQFGSVLQGVANFFGEIQNSIVGGERLLKLLQIEPEIKNKDNSIPLENLKGHIEFKNVRFSYGEIDVLNNITVDIGAKQRLAIVGPTGAGKTTFASLIPRFYDVIEGSILIDGIDIRDYDLHSLRLNVGMVLQDTYLFAESIMENIRFGKRTATDEEVYSITKKIGIHDFIQQLPKGYNTKVGERGAILSIGQKQLIAFASTLLSNPPILILDEATSSVDAYSEVLIQNALDELLKSRTCIIIAHRLSTIVTADKIIVMDDGNIIQQGNHSELMKDKNGLYHKFYMMQFAENE